ncbi:hypothetical protein MY3957_001414 [Beauveria namnaoensis]
MSGSPPFEPARTAQDLSSCGSSPRYGMMPLDTSQTRLQIEQQPGRASNQPRSLLPLSNTYPQETSRGPHIRRSSEHRLPPLLTYNTPEPVNSFYGTPVQRYASPASSSITQHSDSQPRSSVPDSSIRALSPRSQRKTKGHVASACVPCKKAHLRCDAQRPCARCVSHGKEDTCVDVRHKKRGRPRLRDDRESRMDAVRFAPSQDGGARRTTNIRPASLGHPSQPSLYDRPSSAAPSASASAFAPPPRIFSADTTVHGDRHRRLICEAPVVYMRTNMDIVKASSSFSEAIGATRLIGRRLMEMVAPETSETMIDVCNALNAEQKRREPAYLPPIYDKGDEAVRALSFAPEIVNRIDFKHHAYSTFRAHDGQPRSYPIRFGLLREGSFFFIAALLSLQSRPLYHQPAATHTRNVAHTLPRASPSSSYAAHAAIDSDHRRYSDGPSALRREAGMARQASPHGTSPSIAYQSIYSASPHSSEYRRQSPLQIPRSEAGTPLLNRSSESQYTLPPIRSLAERPRDKSARDGRQRRLSIGGLINSTAK